MYKNEAFKQNLNTGLKKIVFWFRAEQIFALDVPQN